MVVPLAVTLLAPFVFVIARSAAGLTVSVSVALSLPGVESVVPEGGVIVAVFATEPPTAVTFADTMIW